MSHKEQIDELNTWVKTYIAPSKIHGVGVFALRSIPKGQRLYANIVTKVYPLPFNEFRNLFPEVRKYIIERWPLVAGGKSYFLFPETKIVAFMNHGNSDEVNYDAVNDIVLKDIEVGSEILEDYKLIEGWEKIYTFLVDK